MASSTPLATMRQLKAEEKRILDMQNILKEQLNKLKVEELTLSGKIRALKIKNTCIQTTMKTENIANEQNPDINTINLDLSVNKLNYAESGISQEEEEEDEIDQCDE